MEYAIVSVTHWQNGETYRVIGVTDDIEKASKMASKHRPDYDERVGAHRLSHNQVSPTRGEVWVVVSDGDVNEYEQLEAEADGFVVASNNDGDTYILKQI